MAHPAVPIATSLRFLFLLCIGDQQRIQPLPSAADEHEPHVNDTRGQVDLTLIVTGAVISLAAPVSDPPSAEGLTTQRPGNIRCVSNTPAAESSSAVPEATDR